MLLALALLPWIALPIIALLRAARSRQLANESAAIPNNAELISIIIPARNEAHNIKACVTAALASTYTPLEIIVVNDHSTDNTATIVSAIAQTDPRLKLINNPDLPRGWFGKQWACQNGAHAAQGATLLFLDADTHLTPDALAKARNGMHRTHADLYSVLSEQDMHTVGERIVQPQILTVIAARYGGTEIVNNSQRVEDKLANGQFIMIKSATYRELGGHALVRDHVAEDVKLAQRYFQAGKRTTIVVGWDCVKTRMYTSLQEVIAGWRKNVYAGGRDTIPFGALGRSVFPLALLTPPLLQLIPFGTLVLALTGLIPPSVTRWSFATTMILLTWWAIVYRINRLPVFYALTFPIGALLAAYTFTTAIVRGHNVTWKGRDYRNGDHSLPAI